jgi:hypothetical protein
MTWITIDVDMDEFSDEQLIVELVDRGYVVNDVCNAEDKEELNRIYEALQLGKQEEATRRMKEYVCNKVGRLL